MAGQKVCVGCGVDVSEQQRVKDSKGNYYCEPCWEQKAAQRAAVGTGARAASVAVPPPPPVEEAAIDPATMILFQVSQDQGPFHKMGKQFSAAGTNYMGPAMLTPIALYLVKSARNSQAHGGGLVGAMLSAAFSKNETLSTCKVKDLPANTQGQLDPKKKLREKDVIIIPQSTVSFVKAGGFNNMVSFSVGAEKFSVVTGLFSGGKVKRMLQETGWQINTQLTPTAAPVHDMRTAEERQNPGTLPVWQRVLLVIGAIIIIVLVVAARIGAR